jgi:hypothetical protein
VTGIAIQILPRIAGEGDRAAVEGAPATGGRPRRPRAPIHGFRCFPHRGKILKGNR